MFKFVVEALCEKSDGFDDCLVYGHAPREMHPSSDEQRPVAKGIVQYGVTHFYFDPLVAFRAAAPLDVMSSDDGGYRRNIFSIPRMIRSVFEIGKAVVRAVVQRVVLVLANVIRLRMSSAGTSGAATGVSLPFSIPSLLGPFVFGSKNKFSVFCSDALRDIFLRTPVNSYL